MTKKKNENETVELDKQLEVIAQKFIDNPEPFFKEREKEIVDMIVKYGDLQNEDLESGVITKKDYSLQLTQNLMKPLLKLNSNCYNKHTPHSLQLTSDFYWDKMVLPFTEKIDFVPNIYDLFSLLGISKRTFERYQEISNEEMRETCEMILDRFVAYYQRKGMKKEVSEIMTMFVLKTTFKQRENDVPQVAVVNVNNSPDERIAKFARQNGYEVWNENNK